MTKLAMKFYDNAERKSISISLNDPKPSLDAATVEAAMTAMIGVVVPATAVIDEANYVETTETNITDLLV
jgi:hypothetical protein